MSKISRIILNIARSLGKGFNGGWALFIAVLPVVLFAGYIIVYISNRNARSRAKSVFSAFSDICVYAFLSLSLFSCYVHSDIETGIVTIGLALVLKAAYLILYGVLSAFPAYKEKAKKRKTFVNAEYYDMSESFPPAITKPAQEPKKVRCYTEEIPQIECDEHPADVRLDHIFSVIERLKGMSLGSGDRLEINKYEELLTVYKNKALLSGEEAQTLNDILASLLKLMAKYEV